MLIHVEIVYTFGRMSFLSSFSVSSARAQITEIFAESLLSRFLPCQRDGEWGKAMSRIIQSISLSLSLSPPVGCFLGRKVSETPMQQRRKKMLSPSRPKALKMLTLAV